MRRSTVGAQGGRDPWSPAALIYRFAINATGLFLAAVIVPGIQIGDAPSLIAGTAIFALVNIIVRPVAMFVGFCLIVLTFGLFVLIINTLLFLLTAWIATELGLAFRVEDFLSAFLGALIISLVSLFATMSLRATRL